MTHHSLPSAPLVNMDLYSGNIYMTPTVNITTVFAVLVKEFRRINGNCTLIGSVLRDMQLYVVTGNNQNPKLAGINPAATQYSANDTIYKVQYGGWAIRSIQYLSHDADIPAQNLTLAWNAGIPMATFTVTGNGTPNAVGHFTGYRQQRCELYSALLFG